MSRLRPLLLLAFTAVLPTTAAAQAPVFLLQWASGGINETEFYYPTGVATDAAGNVFVSVTYLNRIEKYTGTGGFVTGWDLGPFEVPTGIATDASGNVFVVSHEHDPDNSLNTVHVRKFAGGGSLVASWGSPGIGDGEFENPQGIATDPLGYVYVADVFNHRIQKFTNDGVYVTQWGSPGSGVGQFGRGNEIATDATGSVYVTDDEYNRVLKFTDNGVFLAQWGTSGSPKGVATDGSGNVYVAVGQDRIQKFSGSGTYITQWGSLGSGNGQFDGPFGVATDPAGNVFVADARNYRIQKFGASPTPTKSSTWGRLKSLYR